MSDFDDFWIECFPILEEDFPIASNEENEPDLVDEVPEE